MDITALRADVVANRWATSRWALVVLAFLVERWWFALGFALMAVFCLVVEVKVLAEAKLAGEVFEREAGK